MKKESCYFFATISKSFKTDGTVIIKNNNGLKEIDTKEPLFIEFNDVMVPFFLEKIEYRNDNSALVKFETLLSEEQTADYIGKEVYIEKSAHEETVYSFDFLLDFRLYDKSKILLGTITDYQDIPGNPLLIVTHHNKEYFVPFHEDFIISIDEKKKEMIIKIPDGLHTIQE